MLTRRIEQFLYFLLFIVCLSAIYTYGFLVKSNGDNIEHIHTSWLLWQNNIPYKDFFQHHNPLIWYMFSPLVALTIDNIMIFSIFNTISVLCFILVVLFEAKILFLLKLNKISVLIFSIITLSAYSLLCSMDYRPDTFMYLFFFMGIFYWFKYSDEKTLKNIVLSFLFFFLSFMCSQKILLNLGLIGLIIIYELATKKIRKQDFCLSLLLPVLLFVLFLTYLYVNDALNIYLKSNYYFNSYIPTIFANQRISFPPLIYYELYVFVPIASFSAIYFLIKGKYHEKIIALLFVEEFCLRFFYFSAFLHYNALFLMLSLILSVMFLSKIKKISEILCVFSIIYIFFALFYNYQKTYLFEQNRKEFKTSYEYTFENTTPCDYVINGYYSVYNLKSKDPGFYSILLGQIDVLGEKLGIRKKSNLNQLVIQYMPKIIYGGVYWDTYQEDRGKHIPVHFIDREIIEKYYDYTKQGNLFILKPQYHKHNCKYNGKSWEYED